MRVAVPIIILTVLVVPSTARAQSAHIAPPAAPARVTIAQPDEPGTPMKVSGRVLDEDGKPVVNASIYVYQTDANGEYVRGQSGGSDRPRLFAFLRSGSGGIYSFNTIKPGSYPSSRNPAHIHFEVVAPGFEERFYEIVFDGDPFISDRFKEQAKEKFGGVVIVKPHSFKKPLDVQHDIRVRKAR